MPYCPKCNSPEVVLADMRLLACAPGRDGRLRNGEPVTGAVKVFRCAARRLLSPPCGATWEVRTGMGDTEMQDRPSTP